MGILDWSLKQNPNDVGYDLILVLGQSNNAGQGTGFDVTHFDPVDPRIFVYGASGAVPAYAGIISQAVEPMSNYGDNGAGGMPNPGMGPNLPFARWLLHQTPPNRRLLLVQAAYGGTALAGPSNDGTGHTWDSAATGPLALYQSAIAQTQAALIAAGPNSRVVAATWLQGEQDGANATPKSTYQTKLDALIDQLRTDLAVPGLPFIIGEMTSTYRRFNSYYSDITDVHIDTPNRKTGTAFWYGAAISPDYDPVNGTVHYNAAAQRLNGRAVFDALPRARANVLGAPLVAPTGLSVSQSGTTANLSWNQVVGRATSYSYQYSIDGGATYTTVTPGTLAVSAAITGLTLGVNLLVQVRSSNEQGTSAWSTVVAFHMVTVPTKIIGLAAGTPLATSVPLNWTAEASSTSYRIEKSLDGGTTWTTAASPDPATNAGTATGLSPSTALKLRVTGLNAAGTGTPSDPLSVTTAALGLLVADVGVSSSGAWSLARKVVSGYAGSLIQIRRSSDNTTQDIGIDGSGNLNVATITSFVGSNSAFVSKVYDQSGNGRDLVQATAANQPRIVNTGTLDTVGSNNTPCGVFNGTSQYFTVASAWLYAANAATVMLVQQDSSVASTQGIMQESRSNASTPAYTIIEATANAAFTTQFIRNDASTILLSSGSSGPTAINGSIHQSTILDTGSAITQRADGTAGTTQAYTRSGTLTLDQLVVGAGKQGGTASAFYGGHLTELVVWSSALTSTAYQAGEFNQKSFHGTP